MEGRPVRLYLDVLGGVFLTLQHLLEPYTIRDVPSPVDDYAVLEDEAGVLSLAISRDGCGRALTPAFVTTENSASTRATLPKSFDAATRSPPAWAGKTSEFTRGQQPPAPGGGGPQAFV